MCFAKCEFCVFKGVEHYCGMFDEGRGYFRKNQKIPKYLGTVKDSMQHNWAIRFLQSMSIS